MKRLGVLLLPITFVLFSMFGCSGDQDAVAPDVQDVQAKKEGPYTEILVCLDVSDGTTAEELGFEVEGLIGCLQNGLPQDGSVLFGALAYGDSVITVVESFVPVTADGIANTVQPALEGLLTDRVVTGATADLDGALVLAAMALAGGTTADRHLLIVGDGGADDAEAAEAECTALAEAGVTVSAVAVGADEAGTALLQGCASGFFAASADSESFAAACSGAFSYVANYQMVLDPLTAELPRGSEHTVTATLWRGDDAGEFPLAGITVDFAVTGESSPNAGVTGSAMTDENGMASFTYTGEGCAGVDTIEATAAHPVREALLMATASVEWTNNAPVCDAGGPYDADLTDEGAVVMLDGSGSSDADESDTLTYSWSVDCEGATFDDATSATPQLSIDVSCGCEIDLMVTLEVSDGCETSSCTTAVTLHDVTPPTIEVGEPVMLWPPNHKHHTITPDMLLVSIYDTCGGEIDVDSVEIVSVTSDEPEDHLGDGRSLEDIVIECPNVVQLRAERAGGNNGRVYAVEYQVADGAGNVATATAMVMVPHDQGGGEPMYDEGAGYSVAGCATDDE